ncbi:uncharacterized protein [Euphorbia lathyris]|uniref:uncharacterized protein n=1 Tax=Euphorbia lathyris TaxID=212925 RepID=UPI0033137047
MAAELQPPEFPLAGMATATATASTTVLSPIEPENTGAPPPATKRQRRPSVRLGEIGDQSATLSYESHLRRTKQHWRLPKDSSKSVKARSITNLVNGNDSHEIQEAEGNTVNGEVNLEFGHRRKARRATTKRVRSNWISKVEEGGVEGDSREEGEEGFRDFDQESDSHLKNQSPVHSTDNAALDMWQGHRRSSVTRARVSGSRDDDAIEMDNLPESDSRERKCSTSEGVRTWLIELGLSRYAPVFEVHEVDDEVLPLLTLEDLKDMGINAVGSRRKLYSAIQKLSKGFS